MGRDVARFVRDSKVVVLGTTSAHERPFATPLWFLPYRDALHLTTGAGSWAGQNIGHHPEVSLLLGGERGRSDRRRLQVDGIAEVHRGLPPASVIAQLGLRYYLSPQGARAELAHLRQWGLRRLYYGQSDGSPGHVRVTVTGARFLPGT